MTKLVAVVALILLTVLTAPRLSRRTMLSPKR